jgi:hypothetical protein
MGESLCRVLHLFLPIQNPKKQLLEIMQRVELTLDNIAIINDNKSEIEGELSIDLDKLIETLKESLNKEEVKEIDNDTSSTDSEQERNKIMIKRKRKKHKKRLVKKKDITEHPKSIIKSKNFARNKLSRNSILVDVKRPMM